MSARMEERLGRVICVTLMMCTIMCTIILPTVTCVSQINQEISRGNSAAPNQFLFNKNIANSGSILVTGGWEGLNQTTIISMGTVNTNCDSFPLPADMAWHVSFSVNDAHIVCGGQLTNDCYMLNVSGRKWDKHSTLNTRRYSANSVVVDSRVLVVGGWDDHDENGRSRKKNTSEFLTDGKWVVGPSIPGEGVSDTCLTHFNSSHIILIGGVHCSKQVFLFDKTTDTWTNWTDVVSLPYGLHGHDCININEGVLFTGGNKCYNDVAWTTSQSWIIDRTGNIEQVGDMTVGRQDHKMIRLGGKVFSVGGHCDYDDNGSIDEWIPASKTWVRTKYNFTTGRLGYSVMALPGISTTLCV